MKRECNLDRMQVGRHILALKTAEECHHQQLVRSMITERGRTWNLILMLHGCAGSPV